MFQAFFPFVPLGNIFLIQLMAAATTNRLRDGCFATHIIGLFLLFLIYYGGAIRVVSYSSLTDDIPTRVAIEIVHQANSWCVARPDASESQLQDALDWACGDGTNLGNADCTAIQSGGTCYNPNTVASHASYAFNAYYQQENRQSGSCYFGGVAQMTTEDPSSGTCVYPSSSSSLATNITTTNPAFGDGISTSFGLGVQIDCMLCFLCLLLVILVTSKV